MPMSQTTARTGMILVGLDGGLDQLGRESCTDRPAPNSITLSSIPFGNFIFPGIPRQVRPALRSGPSLYSSGWHTALLSVTPR